jgi:DNA-binding SARP family transcriptional activator
MIGRFSADGDLGGPLPAGRAELLLKFLLAREGGFVDIDTVIDVLWTDAPPEHAERNVAVLVSRLRRVLGKHRIEGDCRGYRFSLVDGCWLDVAEADRLVLLAERELAERMYSLAMTSAEQAILILGADVALADTPEYGWVLELRERLRSQLRRARSAYRTAAEQLGADRLVIDLAARALAEDPLDEAACRASMRAYQRIGEPAEALRVYERLRQALAETLGTDPSRESQQTHLAVLRGHRVHAESPAERALSQADDLVGRDAELRTLRDYWAEAVAACGGLVVVSGEAGIGKTALVRTFTAEVARAGGLVISGFCYEAERSLYLQPLLQAMREAVGQCPPEILRSLRGRWLGTLTELIPELDAVTGRVPYERAAPELEQRRTLDALVAFLSRIGASTPVLLLLEDMQHAGQSTVESLHFLARRLRHARVLIALTERISSRLAVTSAFGDLARAVRLGPLDTRAVRTLIARSGLSYDPVLFHEWTGGSPLFVVELLSHPDPTTTPDSPGVPESLQQAVADRLTRAGRKVRVLLQRAAVLGVSFTLEDLAAFTGHQPEQCAQRADLALQAGLLVARGSAFRFANDIVHRVAYDSIPEPIRVSGHRRAATLIQQHRPEVAAVHWTAAGDWSRAAEAALRAADVAHLAFANREAVTLLDSALGNAERSGDQRLVITVLSRRGRLRRDLGEPGLARADRERARALVREIGDPVLAVRSLERLG